MDTTEQILREMLAELKSINKLLQINYPPTIQCSKCGILYSDIKMLGRECTLGFLDAKVCGGIIKETNPPKRIV
jgi:hypothetical protein